MQLKGYLLFFCLVVRSLVYAQDASESRERIEWNEFFELTWEDFEGEPDKNSAADAATVIQIKATPYMVKDQVHYDVYAYFNRRESWVRGKSPSLLRHEQLHFDIAELYARLIRKKILDMTANGINDVRVINKAIQVLLEESNVYDQTYDLETLHGAMSKKQEKWEQRVKQQLSGLKDYKKKKRVIAISEELKKRPLIFAG